MKFLGNFIWLIFGGLETALQYFLASLLLMVTIIGIPFGLQTLKIGMLMLWPFGSKIINSSPSFSCLNTIMNIIWFFIGGIWIWLSHIVFGLLFFITIIGIPFGKQHWKLATLALNPFGKVILWSKFIQRTISWTHHREFSCKILCFLFLSFLAGFHTQMVGYHGELHAHLKNSTRLFSTVV